MDKTLQAVASSIIEEAIRILKMKQEMYVGNGSPFKNFLTIEDMTGIPADKIVVGRMIDKLYRIQHIKVEFSDKTSRDSVRDAIIDLINYAILYMYYLEHQEEARNISRR